ncbi:MAG TPA: phage baseplate assembly protein V [Gemmatimonadaceae bacterium]|nr:phage baseplate assembly protein V [Gemmatimonadaceae bacterium]
MTSPLATMRALVREEQDRRRFPELGIVTQVFAKGDEGGKENHQVAIKLPASDVELLRAPVAVGRLGLSALPRVGDLVLVVFINGDINAPIVVVSLYDYQQHPPKGTGDEVVYQVPDDAASGVRRLHVELPSGATLTMDDDKLAIVYGSTKLEVNRDGSVDIESATSVSVKSSSDLTLEAQGNISISAQGTLDLKGVQVNAQAQAAASLKGAQISLAGMTQFSPA